MKFKNNYPYDVCWKGIRVKPGQTVEEKKIKEKEVDKDGMD